MKVLFAYDGSQCAETAIDDLYRAGLPENTHLVILSIVEDWTLPPSSLEIIEDISRRNESLARARRAAARMRWFHQGWVIEVEVAKGSPAAGIIKNANQLKSDLIVLGSHGREAPVGAYFGSVAQKVLHEAPCSVRIARGRYVLPDSPLRIIIGMDGSESANEAVKVVSSRNWPKDTEIRLVNTMLKTMHVAAGLGQASVAPSIIRKNARARKAFDSALTTLESAGLKTSVVVKDEELGKLLCREAENWRADCIFVGSQAAGRIEHSGVCAEVAADAFCSVEVIRTPV